MKRHIKMLEPDISKVASLGFGALAYSIIKGSPQLKSTHMECNRQEAAALRTTIQGMPRAAGRTASVETEISVAVTE